MGEICGKKLEFGNEEQIKIIEITKKKDKVLKSKRFQRYMEDLDWMNTNIDFYRKQLASLQFDYDKLNIKVTDVLGEFELSPEEFKLNTNDNIEC